MISNIGQVRAEIKLTVLKGHTKIPGASSLLQEMIFLFRMVQVPFLIYSNLSEAKGIS